MNIVFEHAVTSRVRGGSLLHTIQAIAPCGNSQLSKKRFNVKLTPTAGVDGNRECEKLFWAYQTTCRDASDLISRPIKRETSGSA